MNRFFEKLVTFLAYGFAFIVTCAVYLLVCFIQYTFMSAVVAVIGAAIGLGVLYSRK